jgi:YD repeat-containing protein
MSELWKRFGAILFALAMSFGVTHTALAITFDYDGLGRVVRATYDNGKVVEYTYDPAGNRSQKQTGTPPSTGFSINDASATEAASAVFTVTRTGDTSAQDTVNYYSVDTSTTSTSDYTPASGTLTFAIGETNKTISVTPVDDDIHEQTETYVVKLVNPLRNGSLAPDLTDDEGQGTITDNDLKPVFSIVNTSGLEGGPVQFTVTRSGAQGDTDSVDFQSIAGTASEISDFIAQSGTLTFAPSAPGTAMQTITVSGVDDLIYEDDEAFTVRLLNSSSNAEITSGLDVATGTITENDAPPDFVVYGTSSLEQGVHTASVTKVGATALTHVVDWATSNGTATAGTDYTAASGQFTFAAADTVKSVNITVVNDTVQEADEALNVTLANPTNNALLFDDKAIITIRNDDGVNNAPIANYDAYSFANSGQEIPPFQTLYPLGNDSDPDGDTLTISGVTQPNGGGLVSIKSGNTSLLFNAGGWGTQEFTYTISDGNGGLSTASFTIFAGTSGGPNTPPVAVDDNATGVEDTPIVIIATTNDTDADGNGLTITSVTTPSDGTISYAASTLTFTPDTNFNGNDSVVYTVSDGHGGVASALAFFTVTPISDAPVTVNDTGTTAFNVALTLDPRVNDTDPDSDPLTITGKTDGANGTVSFTASSVTYTPNTNWSGSDSFTYTISDGTGGTDVGTVNVTVEAPPSFSIADASTVEGSNASFTVTRSGSTVGTYAVDYATATGSAGSGDFTAVSGTLTFTGGQTSKTVVVNTTQDTATEGNETFTVILSNQTSGSTISDGSAVGTITDDEASLSITDASASEGNAVTFTVMRTGYLTQTATVNYASATGGAGSSDFTAVSGTLTFTSGQSSKSVVVNTAEDAIYENNETFTLNLSGASGAGLSDNQAIGTITNDDAAPSFSINNVSASEGNLVTFTVTKTGSTSKSHSVNYFTAANSANSTDYTPTSGTLTFTSAQSSKTIAVTTLEDLNYENNEVFYVDLSSSTQGATISDSRGNGTITNDDAAPAFSINNKSVSEGGTLTFTVTKSGATAKTHAVNYATANGSATTADYTAKSGTLTFTSGQTSKTVSVPTIEETLIESNETLTVNLSAATAGATISDSQGIGTIINDDINASPNAVNDSSSMTALSSKNVYVLSNDSDPNGQTLTITSVTQPTNGVMTIKASGTYLQVYGVDPTTSTGTYTISDGYGGSDTAYVTVTVTGGGGGGGGWNPP